MEGETLVSEERRQDIADSMSPETFAVWLDEIAKEFLRARAVFWRFGDDKVMATVRESPRIADNIRVLAEYLNSIDRKLSQVMHRSYQLENGYDDIQGI